MKLLWDITPDDTAKVKDFLARHKDNSFVKNRLRKNVEGPRPSFSRDVFWHQMLACLLTSQQKSGPKSPVSRLIHTDPFPLGYPVCVSCGKADALVRDALAEWGGIRRYERIADEAANNLRRLEHGLWSEIEQAWERLTAVDDRRLERETARMIDSELNGFGPKQARNLLQGLGLTKYEIPLDSRVAKRLVEFGFPLAVSGQMLLVSEAYELILDGVQELCRRCEVYPCVLDAAMFASFDGDGWEGVKTIW